MRRIGRRSLWWISCGLLGGAAGAIVSPSMRFHSPFVWSASISGEGDARGGGHAFDAVSRGLLEALRDTAAIDVPALAALNPNPSQAVDACGDLGAWFEINLPAASTAWSEFRDADARVRSAEADSALGRGDPRALADLRAALANARAAWEASAANARAAALASQTDAARALAGRIAAGEAAGRALPFAGLSLTDEQANSVREVQSRWQQRTDLRLSRSERATQTQRRENDLAAAIGPDGVRFLSELRGYWAAASQVVWAADDEAFPSDDGSPA